MLLNYIFLSLIHMRVYETLGIDEVSYNADVLCLQCLCESVYIISGTAPDTSASVVAGSVTGVVLVVLIIVGAALLHVHMYVHSHISPMYVCDIQTNSFINVNGF